MKRRRMELKRRTNRILIGRKFRFIGAQSRIKQCFRLYHQVLLGLVMHSAGSLIRSPPTYKIGRSTGNRFTSFARQMAPFSDPVSNTLARNSSLISRLDSIAFSLMAIEFRAAPLLLSCGISGWLHRFWLNIEANLLMKRSRRKVPFDFLFHIFC